MNRQYGFSTLIITASLAGLMAIYAFNVVKLQLFDIKKTQNIIEAKQLKANAESALECALAEIMASGKSPDDSSIDLSGCSDGVIVVTNILKPSGVASDNYQVAATAKNITTGGEAVAKMIVGSTATEGSSAAVASAGSLIFDSSQEIVPYEGQLSDQGYQCQSVITSGTLELRNNSSLIVRNPPKGVCASNYKTSIDSTGAVKFGADIIQHAELDLFRANFGVPKAQWETVRSQFEVISGTETVVEVPQTGTNMTIKVVDDCFNKIMEVYNKPKAKAGKQREIWVDGTCILKSDEQIGPFAQTVQPEDAVTLVIQDGVFVVEGSLNFHGNLYVFHDKFSDAQMLAAWEKLSSYKGNLANETFSEITSLLRGTFHTYGTMNFDTPGKAAYIQGTINPNFVSENIFTESRPDFLSVQVLEGSWHDF